MVSTSISIFSPTYSFSSQFNSNAYYYHYKPTSSSNLSIKVPNFRINSIFSKQSSGSSSDDSAAADQFSSNNSIADFMRFRKGIDGGGDSKLQTAIVSYRKKFPWSIFRPFLQVDLVSTIHIGDKEYFAALQEGLGEYDCVLYEMVASREILESRRNSIVTKRLKSSRSRGFNILGCIQRQMARFLALDFQLDCLDYQAGNWYHADLDFETFQLLQLEKGESIFTFARDMAVKSTKAILQRPSTPEDLGFWRSKLLWASRSLPMPLVGLFIIGSVCADTGSDAAEYSELEALSRLDFSAAMKVFLAKRLTSEFTQVTAEIEENSVIIGERNRVAVEALQRAIDEGHNRIAVLYGGGHMPDLGRRLREEFNLSPAHVRWVTAWSIQKRDVNSSSLPFLKTMAEVSGWPLNRYQTLALLIFSSVLAVDLWFWELFFDSSVNWISQIASDILQYVDTAQLM